MSSKSSVELNPIRVSGIREIARVLLNHEDFISLCTAAITDIPPGKSRAHIRGFLKSYGQQLDTEANSPLEHQAARFVREVAGKIADELRWSITGFNEARALDPTGEEKPDLEKWLSTVEPGWNSDTNLPPAGDDGSDGDKSEDNPDFDARFPNIGAVKEFLLSSNAFETLLQALDNWTNVKTRSIRPTRQRTGPAPDSNVMMNLNDDVIPTDATAPVASDKLEKSLPHDSTTNSSSHPAGRPENFRSLISGLLDFWGVSFIFYDILELFVPPVPTGFERIRWRCVSVLVLLCAFGREPLLTYDSRVTRYSGEISHSMIRTPWLS